MKKRLLQVLGAVKEAFQNAGTPIDDVVLNFALKLADGPEFQQLSAQPEHIARAAIAAGCLQAARENIGLPEAQWVNFLQKLRTDVSQGLRATFRREMNQVIKELPRTPGTGRNEILDSPQKRKKVCDLVSKYERKGDSKRQAYEKVAREMNCSARTIQRAWKNRGSRLSKSATRRLWANSLKIEWEANRCCAE